MSKPAYSRLQTDERRAQLLAMGTKLFTEYSYEELSMAKIAKEVGVSKALLYHYFASKTEFFMATLADTTADLAARVAPDPNDPISVGVRKSLRAYVDWIDEHRESYVKLLRSAVSIPEIEQMTQVIRQQTANWIIDSLASVAKAEATPQIRTATKGWIWFIDGTILDWLENDSFPREDLVELLAGTLEGALRAAGSDPFADALRLALANAGINLRSSVEVQAVGI